jgi:hypothetical protein
MVWIGFIIGPVENGCQLISASSIKTVTNCVTCTISTITYPFCDGTTYVTGPQTGRQYDDFRCGGNSCVLKGTEITMFDGSIKSRGYCIRR